MKIFLQISRANDSDVQYAIVKKDALENITDLIELEDMMYDSMVTFASNSNLYIRNSYIAGLTIFIFSKFVFKCKS